MKCAVTKPWIVASRARLQREQWSEVLKIKHRKWLQEAGSWIFPLWSMSRVGSEVTEQSSVALNLHVNHSIVVARHRLCEFFLFLNERGACSHFDNRNATGAFLIHSKNATVQWCLSKYRAPQLLNSWLLHDNTRQHSIHPEEYKNRQFLTLKSLGESVTHSQNLHLSCENIADSLLKACS